MVTTRIAALAAVLALGPRGSAAGAEMVLVGARFGAPTGLSGSLGFAPFPTKIPLVFELDAGTGGARLGVGVVAALTMGSSGGNEPLPGLFHTLTFRGVAVRTWGSPIGVDPDRTLVGGEVEYSLLYLLTLHVGVLCPVDGKSERDFVASFGVGVNLAPFLNP
jgi:hypothetical protein